MLITTTVEDAEASILRVLRDAAGEPVPLADLDGLTPLTALFAALARLTRAGVVDVQAGHIALSASRIHQEER